MPRNPSPIGRHLPAPRCARPLRHGRHEFVLSERESYRCDPPRNHQPRASELRNLKRLPDPFTRRHIKPYYPDIIEATRAGEKVNCFPIRRRCDENNLPASRGHRPRHAPSTQISPQSINVNRYTTRGGGTVAPRFEPMAYAENALVEAYYDPQAPFVAGLQFHPQRMLKEYTGYLKVKSAFAAAARSGKESNYRILASKTKI